MRGSKMRFVGVNSCNTENRRFCAKSYFHLAHFGKIKIKEELYGLKGGGNDSVNLR